MLHNFCQILCWKFPSSYLRMIYIYIYKAISYSIVMDLITLKACVPLGYLPGCKISGEYTFLLLRCVLSLMTSLFSFLQTVPSQGLCVRVPVRCTSRMHLSTHNPRQETTRTFSSCFFIVTSHFLSFFSPLTFSSQTMLHTAVSPWCLTERCTIFRLKGLLFKGIKVCLKGNTIPSSADWQSALSFVSCVITEQWFSSDLCLLAVSCWEYYWIHKLTKIKTFEVEQLLSEHNLSSLINYLDFDMSKHQTR